MSEAGELIVTDTNGGKPGPTLSKRYDPGINVEVGRVTRDYSKSPQAEVTIDVDKSLAPERPRRVFRGRLGLLSRSGIKACVDICNKRVPGYAWADVIDDICDKALENQRQRLTPESVGLEAPPVERPVYQVWPLLPSRQPTIIYGQGGIGKSWLALYLCALVDNGLTVSGLNADVGKSLYVDWETDAPTVGARAWAIKGGEPQIESGWTLRYQRAQRPLVEWIDDLSSHVEREGFDLVVIDSVGMALGGDASSDETVLAFFLALRQLETTVLLIDHMTKGSDSKERGAYGSVYKRNSARSVWEMRQAENGEMVMGLYHRKANSSRLSPPVGLSLNIIEDDNAIVQAASFSRCDVGDLPDDLAAGMTLPQRIQATLSRGQQPIETIRGELDDAPASSVDAVLSRMFKRGQLTKPSRGTYGLVHHEAN